MGRFWQRITAVRLGPGGRIIAAVVAMGLALVLAAMPLGQGLDKSARLASLVSENLVPTSNRVVTLVKNVLDAQNGLEAYLLTGNEAERDRFFDAKERVYGTLDALQTSTLDNSQNTTIHAQLAGVRDLMGKLETQAEHVFDLHKRPDNVISAHLINTRGEKLLMRTNAFVDLFMEDRFASEGDVDILFLSALMGYQDSLNRMMGSVRGYLFMKEAVFRNNFDAELKRNNTLYSTIAERMTQRGASAVAYLQILSASRSRLLAVFDNAFETREGTGWRRDFDYYQTHINPTLESVKWVLNTLSESTSQEIATISGESMVHGLELKRYSMLGALAMLLLGACLGVWIYLCVRLFTDQIGDASTQLTELSEQLREETEQHAVEAGCQVEEIGRVHRTLNDFKGALSRIRDQTEEMAQQTDSASLECVQGMEVLGDSQDRMGAILTNAQAISAAMGETKVQTRQMDGIVAILDELVEQTKLLSFNATIEAAGAGENGTRFAVVAKHVRRLATRAQEATQEIRTVIKNVQDTTDASQKATERGTQAVYEGENLMNVVTERLDAIVGSVTQVSDLAGSIFLATQAQEHAIGEVSAFATKAADTASRVSSHTEEALTTAGELQRTAHNLSRLVGK